jgi:uridine phosphorylase
MECSAIYGLSKMLGHKALTVCLIIANRVNLTASKDYQPDMLILIEKVLQNFTK